MNTIKETVTLAKNGNEIAKKTIRKHYLYMINHYYEKYCDKITKKELVVMYDIFLDEYYNVEQQLPLPLFLHKSFITVLHSKFNRKDIDVNETIILACQGDKEARDKLINHFVPLVYRAAKKYDYLEYEDLVQNGIIKLIENIDNLIELHENGTFFTNTLSRNINTYFDKILREEVIEWQQPEYYSEDNFLERISKLELDDFIESYPCISRNKEMVKEYLFDHGTYKGIAKERGLSHEFVRLTVKEIGKSFQKIR